MKRVPLFLILAVIAGMSLSVSVAPANAQTASSGSVTGQVSDPQGAIVPGADVTLTDTATKSSQTTTTNDAGRYSFPVVNPGTYDLLVSKQGFKIAKFSNQKVSIGAVLTLNVSMEVGALTETVVVTTTAAGTESQTAEGTIGNRISLKDIGFFPKP